MELNVSELFQENMQTDESPVPALSSAPALSVLSQTCVRRVIPLKLTVDGCTPFESGI